MVGLCPLPSSDWVLCISALAVVLDRDISITWELVGNADAQAPLETP